ncbi:unnamed protein product [Brassica napus]|uniref:(rape) hypothetical protein n=1 Tax=Brassica napus TaxID=3708 RepID=A0A816JV98_BRANA|nr:unnamed protein product [Brassica napus]
MKIWKITAQDVYYSLTRRGYWKTNRLLFPPYTKGRRHHPYESTHRRPLFPQKEGRVWRQKTYPAEEQEVNSPVTYLRRQAVESNLQQENGEIAVIGNQSQTREQILQDIDKATQLYLSCDDPTEAAARRLRVLAGDASGQVEETVTTMLAGSDPQADDSHKTHPLGTSSQVQSRDLIMEELQNVTLQYLSCADPAEAAARRLRVLAGDAQGQMEEVAADILAANTPQAAAGIGMVEQRDVIVTPIRDNDQTKTTQNDQPQEELMQRSESDGDIPPRRRRIER